MKISKYALIIIAILSITACKKDTSKPIIADNTKMEVPTKDELTTPKVEEVNSNFKVNDYFETFIKANNSGENMVNINKPKMGGELLRKADKVKLEINGYWVNDKANAKDKLTLEVFPNSFKQNDGNRSIIEQKLSLKKENKYLLFGYLKHLSLEDGLYYYFLKNKGIIVYTGKFMVKR